MKKTRFQKTTNRTCLKLTRHRVRHLVPETLARIAAGADVPHQEGCMCPACVETE